MADINSNININVSGNAEDSLNNISNKLNGLQTNQTKITQSTSAFTKETNKLNDGLIKNGGAMGLLSAATGGLAMDFKDGIEAVEGLGISMKGLRGAIISTGIGALAILVLELVTNWDKWIGVIDGSTAAMDRLNSEIDSNNKKREESNRITQLTTSALEEELRLMIAQGVEQDKIIAQQNTISAAKKEQAQADKLRFEDDLRNIQQLIDSNSELLELNRELKQLEEGKIRLQNAGSDFSVTQQAIIDKKSEISELEKELGLNEKRKVALDGIADAQLIINTTTMDPKVRAAEAATALRDANRTKELERQKKLQDEINASLQRGLVSAKTLNDINLSLRGSTLADLTPQYTKFKQFTDTFNQLRDAAKKTEKSIAELQGRQLNDTQKTQLLELENSLKSYNSSIELIRGNLKRLIKLRNEESQSSFLTAAGADSEAIQLQKLIDTYDLLTDKVMKYKRANFNEYQYQTSENIQFINDKLLQKNTILQKQFDIEEDLRKSKMKSFEDEVKILTARQSALGSQEILTTITDKDGNKLEDVTIKIKDAAKEIRDQMMGITDDFKFTFSDSDDALLNQYFDFTDKIEDFNSQFNQTKKDQTEALKVLELESNQLFQMSLIEQERMSLDARYKAQEEYYNKVQILSGNVYSFLGQLQNEQLISSKDVRNALLVAQKGAEIAQVVIGTVRENAKLKQQAGEYAGNAALYFGLASTLGPINPVLGAAYAGAGTNYAAAGSRSLAQIPVNWGIAAGSIGAIAATTITSWNKSTGGGAGGSAGGSGGGGSAAQFNIVGSSGENQLAATIAAQQNQPLRAYVVGSDITTQQAIDRNIVRNSTFL
jgi:hypothetical protein